MPLASGDAPFSVAFLDEMLWESLGQAVGPGIMVFGSLEQAGFLSVSQALTSYDVCI